MKSRYSASAPTIDSFELRLEPDDPRGNFDRVSGVAEKRLFIRPAGQADEGRRCELA